MNTFVEGSYATVEDALRAVDTLIMRGHDTEAITLISNQAHQEEQLDAVDISVKHLSELSSQECHRLGKHIEDVNEGRFVLQVTEEESESKETSPDINPLGADSADPDNDSVAEDAELLEDVRNSNVDPSSHSSNSSIGYSDNMKNPSDTPLDNGPNRTL